MLSQRFANDKLLGHFALIDENGNHSTLYTEQVKILQVNFFVIPYRFCFMYDISTFISMYIFSIFCWPPLLVEFFFIVHGLYQYKGRIGATMDHQA